MPDPLNVRALVLSDGHNKFVLVSVDALTLYEDNYQYLLDVLRNVYGFSHVSISTTHTHSGYFPRGKSKALNQSIVDAVLKADQISVPVKIGANATELNEVYNRITIENGQVEMLWTNPERLPTREVSNTVDVIHFKTLDDKPYLSLINYSAHPVVTMDLNKVVISADYPGYIIQSFSKQSFGKVLFTLGAAGEVNPYDANTKPHELALKKAQKLGVKVANAAHLAIEGISQYEQYGNFVLFSRMFTEPKARVGEIKLTSKIVVAHFPGEYFNEFAVDLKKGSPFQHTLFVSMSNGELGYVPTEKASELGGYGANLTELKVKKTTGREHVNYVIKALQKLHTQ